MNLGEKSAVEAMLGLSRPNYSPPSSFTPSLPSLSTNTTTTAHHSAHDITCGSSVSPSLSPVQHIRLPRPPQQSDLGRPKAMRLSQLLTDDSPPENSSLPSTDNLIPQQPHHHHLNHLQLHHSLHLPLSASTPTSAALPVTEPVTPPFSPPVLPPLSTVTAIPITHVANNTDKTSVPQSSTWMPTQLSSVNSANTVLTARNAESEKGVTPNSAKRVVQDHTNNRSTTETLKKIVKRPYKKYYSNPTPSSHCHVCARTSKAVKFAICARIAEGLCRKVTCYKCFTKFGWDWESAVNSKTWICVHCRGVCPEGRSQCYIYSRVNSKRESKRKKGGKTMSTQGIAVIGSQSSHQGGHMVRNVAPAPPGFPSMPRMNIQEEVTSFSNGNSLHLAIRPL